MIRVNLLPVRAARKKENVRRQVSIFFLTVFFGICAMGYFFFNLNGTIGELTDQISNAQLELTELQAISRKVKEIQDKLNKLNANLSRLKIDIANYRPLAEEKKDKKEAKPLFKIKMEKETKEIFSLKELLRFALELGQRHMSIQRYKGLGEMNPGQLWETTMDPERRTMQQVTVEDAVAADAMFTVLMGDQVEPRRKFIEKHAPEVKILDI